MLTPTTPHPSTATSATPSVGRSRFCVVWQPASGADGARPSERDVGTVDHAAHYAMALAHALQAAGTPPSWLEVDVAEARVGAAASSVYLDVRGHVPGLDAASFESVARIAVSGCRLWDALPGAADVRLHARLVEPSRSPLTPSDQLRHLRLPQAASAATTAASTPARSLRTWRGAGRGMAALAAGVALASLAALAVRPGAPAEALDRGAGATAAAAATAPVPAAPPAEATPTSLPAVLLDERFGLGTRGWPNDPHSTAAPIEGGYRLAARVTGRFVAVGAPLPTVVRDVVVSATFRKLGGPPGGGFGLLVRDRGPGPRDGVRQDGTFYVLAAGDQGEVGIWQRDGDRWLDLVPWTRNDAVRTKMGVANVLEARAEGTRLALRVNGALAAQVDDAEAVAGGVGVFAGGDGNEVVLERFTVRQPE